MIAPLAGGDLPPELVTPPPGPRSRELSAELARRESPGVNTLGAADAPAIVWQEALGANVLDVDGNRYVDLTAGFGVAAVGHRHPAVVAAVARQAGELLHGLGDVAAHPSRIALAQRLASMAPVDDPRVHFAISGADAVEIALKSALAATGRAGVVAFDPGYHGTTLGALAASSRPEFRAPFAAHLHEHVVRLDFGTAPENLARELRRGRIGAVVVEPVVGREGVIVPPAGWLGELARLARDAGALLVVDEIFTGFGRTGRLFAVERDGVRPDLLCVGKALGGGLPIAATIGRRAVMERWRVAGEALHTATFLAHPLACAAALATLDLVASERLVERARALGDALGPRLRELAGEHCVVRAVRGVGALWALELADSAAARALVTGCRGRGVLLLAGGPRGCVVQLAPPLTIAPRQLDAALAALAAEIARLEASHAG